MKKAISKLLVLVLLFASLFTLVACANEEQDPTNTACQHEYEETSRNVTCAEGGTATLRCKLCGDTKTETIAPGHDFGDSYLVYVPCSRCGTIGRADSVRKYDDVFVVTFDNDKKAEIDQFYQDMLDNLDSAEEYDAVKHANTPNASGEYDHTNPYYVANKEGFEQTFYDKYYEYLEYVSEQYQYAYVFYCVHEGDESYEKTYNTLSDYRTDMVKNFYALYRLIHQTQYREFFFSKEEGWTDEDIEKALVMSDSYGADAYAEFNKRADEILVAFRDIKNPGKDKKVLELYEEFVEVNNQIAKLAGYENYMEYAYKNIYDRDYTPADVAKMREYVKNNLGTVFSTLVTKDSVYQKSSNYNESVYKAINDNSLFTSKETAKIVADYLKEIKSDSFNSPMDYYSHANELFKNGNYYTGKHKGAFSYYIPAQESTVLYFGPGSYSGAFTFIHEFGHYYNNIYNPGLSLSMDHDETQSQGNEMLFLAWLADNIGTTDDTYNKILCNKLFDALGIVIMATAVDEFEQAVYEGHYGTDRLKSWYYSISKEDYDSLFTAILSSYGGGASSLDSSYWRYVVIEAPGYYISYAMSSLPTLDLYAKAMTLPEGSTSTKKAPGFEDAMTSYLKLYSFSDDQTLTRIDGDNDKVVDATYQEILNYCGLQGPFQKSLYTSLKTFFTNLFNKI